MFTAIDFIVSAIGKKRTVKNPDLDGSPLWRWYGATPRGYRQILISKKV
jgi:hypothetical protein